MATECPAHHDATRAWPAWITARKYLAHKYPAQLVQLVQFIHAQHRSTPHLQGPILPGMLLNCIAITTWMKLWSYAHCNWDYRRARREGVIREGERGAAEVGHHSEASLQYPENLTINNLAYFMMAPTLLYQVGDGGLLRAN